MDIPEGRHLNLNLDDCEDEDWDSQYYWLWDGAIPITCEGCDLYHLLVVSGPERGNMWFTAEETPYIAPISGVVQEPESVLHSLYEYGGGGRLSFLDWYEHWLKIGLQRAVK